MCKKKTDWKERFWSYVEKSSNPDGCWYWWGTIGADGYGVLNVDGKMKRVPRLAWELTKGELPSYLCVLHVCDNPRCVNPDHLVLGTRRDNMLDKQRKGRQAKGEDAGNVKLTTSKVQLIRGMYDSSKLTQQQLAELFSVSQPAICRIVNHDCWKHVA